MTRGGFSIAMSDVYVALLQWLLSGACPEQTNARTNHKVKVGRGGTSFRVDLSNLVLPTVGVRRLYPKSAAAETAWYIHGEQDVAWMRKHAPLWDKFVEADGKTILAAYGYRWRKHFQRDQLALAIDALKHDPSDRRVFVSAWDPGLDGLGATDQRNVPCPTSFNFFRLGDEIHSALYLRSSDVFVGLPYDVMGHAFLMDAVAKELGVSPGVMHVTLGHAHLYEDHYEMAQACVDTPAAQYLEPELLMPGWSVSQIEADRDGYVAEVKLRSGACRWPDFNPIPNVVE